MVNFYRLPVIISLILVIIPIYSLAQNIIVKPYLQDASPSSITIMWEAENVGSGSVEWGADPFNLINTVNSSSIIGNGNSRIHNVFIGGLQQASKYYYRVKMGSGSTSYVYHFTTPPTKNSEQKTGFVAISDMQRDGGNPNVYTNLIKNGIIPVVDSVLENGIQGLHGLIIPGDLVQTGGTYSSWRTDFFNLGDSLTPYVPIYPVPGNHEYYGGGLPNFLKYFTLPLNGSVGNPEEWWYKDISNVRLIGLNSNSSPAQLSTQLSWLSNILTEAGNDADIDFVFAQLHHPYKSELWVPGELDFTGDIITLLENFSTTYNKPSLHFFGHTHAYSRGVSRDHHHLWVNVATAGGAIDNWGEYPNADYDEFVISEDEYGFVLMEVEAGLNPLFRLRRFSRGDQDVMENNTLSDDITIKKFGFAPPKPYGIYPVSDSVLISCVKLKASQYVGVGADHQAAHWQVSEMCNFNPSNTINIWKQSVNWYNEINTQAGDDLTDTDIEGLLENRSYCWRVRYRDKFFKWSEWSEPLQFYTKTNNTFVTSNLVSNSGAESGTLSWTGDVESLTSNECNSVPVYVGSRFFAVGGVCANEQNVGIAYQYIDVSSYSADIDAGILNVDFSAIMRGFALNNDKPEMYLEFIDAASNVINITSTISNSTEIWTEKRLSVNIPANTRQIRVVLKGTRLSGTDNDSYFDEIVVKLLEMNCPNCVGSNLTYASDSDGDGFCNDFDCAPSNPEIYPGKMELCDGVDNNCDGIADIGTSVSWTGNGDGVSWSDIGNWNQPMLPLFCQHVVINNASSVIIKANTVINSIEVGTNSSLTIQANTELVINGSNVANQAAAVFLGDCQNYGRLLVSNSSWDGIRINGMLTNQTGALICVDAVTLNDVSVLPNGQLINHSQLELRD